MLIRINMMTDELNLIVINSTFNKTPGQVYKIYPCPNPNGAMPKSVRKVDVNGDMILSEEDKQLWNSQKAVFIPENQPILISHGTTFDLNDMYQAAQWDAIKHSKLIAKDRDAKDGNGNYVIDGAAPVIGKYDNPSGRYGLAELYIERPGSMANTRVQMAKLIHEAEGLIINDSLAHQVLICRLFEKNMANAHPSDVEDYLLQQAKKDPNKVIKFYNAEESTVRLLIIMAQERGVVLQKQEGLYYADIKLGSNLDIAVEYLKDPVNKTLKEAIKQETYPELVQKAKTTKSEKA